MSTAQRQRQEGFYCPSGYQSEYTLFHTTRTIKYVFLDGSQNIAPSHPPPDFEPQVGYLEPTNYYPLVIPDHRLASSYWTPDSRRLPIFVTLSKSQERVSSGWGPPLISRDRLPVFRQLCGEAATLVPRAEDMVGSRALDGEPEKDEDQGLEKKMEREVEEEEEEVDDEEEGVSCLSSATLKEREASP